MLKLSNLDFPVGFAIRVRYRGRASGDNADNFTLERVCEGTQKHFIGQSEHDEKSVSLAGNTTALGLPYKPEKEQQEE